MVLPSSLYPHKIRAQLLQGPWQQGPVDLARCGGLLSTVSLYDFTSYGTLAIEPYVVGGIAVPLTSLILRPTLALRTRGTAPGALDAPWPRPNTRFDREGGKVSPGSDFGRQSVPVN